MTDKEKQELRDGVISIFKRFNILDHTATIGGLRDDILRFINSLQEEPISNPIDFEKELYKAFGQVKDFTLGMRIAKWFYDMGKNSQEPVSDDLLVAANKAWYESEDKESYAETFVDGFVACFNWQKKKDSTPSKDLEELINTLSKRYPEVSFAKLSRIAVRVAKWQQEQMMAKAIDAHCFGFQGAALFSFRLPADNYLVGSEVKVIVVKERNEL